MWAWEREEEKKWDKDIGTSYCCIRSILQPPFCTLPSQTLSHSFLSLPHSAHHHHYWLTGAGGVSGLQQPRATTSSSSAHNMAIISVHCACAASVANLWERNIILLLETSLCTSPNLVRIWLLMANKARIEWAQFSSDFHWIENE